MDKSVFFATPAYGGTIFCDYALSLIRTLTTLEGNHTIHFVKGDSLITRARNNCVAKFLASEATHLLFIDADIAFEPEHVAMLLQAEKEIVCGLYPKKQAALEWVCNALDSGEVIEEGTLREVKYAGTGFMCISRSAIEKVIAANPALAYRADPDEGGHDCADIFGDPVINGRKLSEDWFFCHLWRELGGQIWVDRRVHLKHVGQIIYPIEPPPMEELNLKK